MNVYDRRPRRDKDGDVWAYNTALDAWVLSESRFGAPFDSETASPWDLDSVERSYGPLTVETAEVRLFYNKGSDYVSAPTVSKAFRLAVAHGITPEFAIIH